MADALANYWPFNELEPEIVAPLSRSAVSLELSHDTWLFRQGDPAGALFLLVEGTLDLYQGQPPCWRKRLDAGACIGELPLVVGGQGVRSAAIRAVGCCRLLGLGYDQIRLQLSAEAFERLLSPVSAHHLQRLRSGLEKVFGAVSLPLLVKLDSAMTQRHLSAGEILFEAGDPLDHVWIVDEGRIDVLMDRGGQLARVAELGAGELVGELAMLWGGERTATARARRDTWLRGLEAARLEALLLRHPRAALALAKNVTGRLLRANQQPFVTRILRTLALVPAGDSADFELVLGRLRARLEREREVVVRRRADLPGIEGEYPQPEGGSAEITEPTRRRFGEWLSSQEADGRVVLLVCEAELDEWSRVSIAAADEIVIVGDALSKELEDRLSKLARARVLLRVSADDHSELERLFHE